MGEEFAHGFVELFQANVFGKDIAEARYNAWTALEKALGDSLSINQWQLAGIEHQLTPQEKEKDGENVIELVVVAQATFKFNSDSDGGQSVPAELFPPIGPGADSLETPKEHEVTKA